MNHLDIEIRAWPPNRYDSVKVMAIHTPTGIAVIVGSEPTRERNQRLACERLGLLVVVLPWRTP